MTTPSISTFAQILAGHNAPPIPSADDLQGYKLLMQFDDESKIPARWQPLLRDTLKYTNAGLDLMEVPAIREKYGRSPGTLRMLAELAKEYEAITKLEMKVKPHIMDMIATDAANNPQTGLFASSERSANNAANAATDAAEE